VVHSRKGEAAAGGEKGGGANSALDCAEERMLSKKENWEERTFGCAWGSSSRDRGERGKIQGVPTSSKKGMRFREREKGGVLW